MNAAERLAKALREEGLEEMADKAAEGYYGDFTSPLTFPILTLVSELQKIGKYALADRAVHGEFDGE